MEQVHRCGVRQSHLLCQCALYGWERIGIIRFQQSIRFSEASVQNPGYAPSNQLYFEIKTQRGKRLFPPLPLNNLLLWKHFAYSILEGCLLLSLNAAFAQNMVVLTGRTPYFPVIGKSLLNLYTIQEIPEFVTGVEGKALLYRRYSTWMDTTTEGDVSSLSDGLLWNLIRRILLPYGNQRHSTTSSGM